MSTHEQKPSTREAKTPGVGLRHAGWLAVAVLMSPACKARGQDQTYVPRTGAYLPYSSPEPVKYNLKFGKLTARLSGGISMEFNDNVNLSQNDPHADLSIGPSLNVGFLYPFTKEHVLQFDFGMMYRWYLNSPSINTISVMPNSHLDHTIIIDSVRINIHDNFGVQVDPLSRAEISGTPGKLVNFRRFHNTIGLVGEWRPTRDWGFFAGYDYSIDRSLSDDFANLDLDTHTFSAGADYTVNPTLSAGLRAGYSITEYSQKIQNGGYAYNIGPTVTWRATKYVTFNASAGYSVSGFDSTGTITDTSGFTGITYQVGARHMINKRMSHDLRFGFSVGQGLGSNFTESQVVQYALRAQLGPSIALATSFAWENARSSGIGAEVSDRFLFNLSTGYQLTRRWGMGLSYAFAWKDSNQLDRDYTQTRVTLDFSRQF